MKYFSSGLYVLSVLCFCTALYFPSFSTETGASDGLALLITGWLGIFVDPGASLSWLANPFYILSVVGMLNKKDSNLLFILSLVSFLLAVSFLGVKSIIIDAGGREKSLISYGLGYWMWVSSPFIMMLSQYIEIKRCEKLKKS